MINKIVGGLLLVTLVIIAGSYIIGKLMWGIIIGVGFLVFSLGCKADFSFMPEEFLQEYQKNINHKKPSKISLTE
jgi:hypothetical protein